MSLLANLRLNKKKKNSFYKDEVELHLVRFLCSSKSTSIDVGSNKGNYTLEMSKYSKNVISIEPNTRYNKYLKRMPKNCEIMNKAVSTLKENIYLHVPIKNNRRKYNEAFTSQNKNEPNSAFVSNVDPIRLDNFIDQNISMIKIDVEGNEMNVLNSGIKLIEKHRPNFIIESLNKNEFKNQLNFFKEKNYIALKLLNNELHFAYDETIFDKCNQYDRNTIFISS